MICITDDHLTITVGLYGRSLLEEGKNGEKVPKDVSVLIRTHRYRSTFNRPRAPSSSHCMIRVQETINVSTGYYLLAIDRTNSDTDCSLKLL